MNIAKNMTAMADWLDFSDPNSPFFGWLIFALFIGALISWQNIIQAIFVTLMLALPIGLIAIVTIMLLRSTLYLFAFLLNLFSQA